MKTRLGRPDDPQEREADRLAAAPARSANPQAGQGPRRAPAPADLPAPVREALSGPGRPLDAAARSELESRIGADFGDVRVHADEAAAASARALDARAYTVGADIVFDRGEYRPGAASGRELIAHELVHTLQQSASGVPAVQRDGPSSAPDKDSPPTLPLPGGLTLFPGVSRLYDIQGAKIPLPGSLRLTNALGVGSGPSFVLDMAPERLVLSLLGRVDLSVSDTPGTPPQGSDDPNQKARVSLIRPVLKLDPKSGKLSGTATLQVPSGYPLTLKSPTELDVELESTEIGKFSGKIGYGPLHADMSLRLHYDTDRLEDAARPVFAPKGGFSGFSTRLAAILRAHVPGVQLSGVLDALESLARSVADGSLETKPFAEKTIALVASSVPAGADLDGLRKALGDFATELSHPGFSLQGSLRLGSLPLSGFSFEAPTTVPLASPLLGAPTAFPSTSSAYGVVLAPPGSITDIAVPAFGYSYSSFDAKSGFSFTSAALPTLSPTAISAGGRSFNEQFPVYVFAEATYVRRVARTVDLGLRLTAQFSTPDLTGRAPAEAGDINTLIQENAKLYQQKGGDEKPPVPNFGLTVVGRF
jgi:hypothetical protein